jgi:hypothetical protein
MRDIERAQGQFLLSNLEARLTVAEIELTALNFELRSPQIRPERRAEAIARSDAMIVEWGETMTKLEELRRIYMLPSATSALACYRKFVSPGRGSFQILGHSYRKRLWDCNPFNSSHA